MKKNEIMRGACRASQEATLAIELFLNENYRFRRNTLNGKVEFQAKPKGSGLQVQGEGAHFVL